MKNFFIDIISNNSTVSSARFLNVFGAVVLSGVYISDFVVHKVINIDATTIMAMYYGGVYGLSKGLTMIKDKMGNSIERKEDAI